MNRRKVEVAKQNAALEGQQWWEYTRRAASSLRAGVPPPELTMHGLVLKPGEHAILQTGAGYSRLYGTSGQYTRGTTLAVGRPAFVLGALAAQGVANHARRRAAERAAAVQWREHQHAPVIVTTQRFLCNTHARGWLSFWFDHVSEFYPDLPGWTVTVGFEKGEPLRLVGPAAPALALWSATAILGDSWTNDPRLALLRSG